DNNANNLFSMVTSSITRNADDVGAALENFFAGENNNGTDFEKITAARKLSPSEFTFHPQLGYITLTRKLQNDEALAVAYEYTASDGRHKVGELTDDITGFKDEEVIFLKLLR